MLFLHGWALGTRAYQRVVRRLTRRGCRVYAPAMPGFAGTAEPPARVDVDDRLRRLGRQFHASRSRSTSPRSSSATRSAAAWRSSSRRRMPDRVGYLVLLNSVGGVTDRPIWEWALRFGRELFPNRQGIEIARAMRDDLVTNLVRNPVGLVRVGGVGALGRSPRRARRTSRARAAGARADDEERRRHSPGRVRGAVHAVGTEGRVLAGRHSWLLTEPDSFDDVLANVDRSPRERNIRPRRRDRRASQVPDALEATNFPARRTRTLLRDAPPLWLMSAPPSSAGGRSRVVPSRGSDRARSGPSRARSTDRTRSGSLSRRRIGAACSATRPACWPSHGLCITDASAATWSQHGLALHALTVENAGDIDETGWERLGEDLRTIGTGRRAARAPSSCRSAARPSPSTGAEPERTLVRVLAPDQIGLLSAICHGSPTTSSASSLCTRRPTARWPRDVFLVNGSFRRARPGAAPQPQLSVPDSRARVEADRGRRQVAQRRRELDGGEPDRPAPPPRCRRCHRRSTGPPARVAARGTAARTRPARACAPAPATNRSHVRRFGRSVRARAQGKR